MKHLIGSLKEFSDSCEKEHKEYKEHAELTGYIHLCEKCQGSGVWSSK